MSLFTHVKRRMPSGQIVEVPMAASLVESGSVAMEAAWPATPPASNVPDETWIDLAHVDASAVGKVQALAIQTKGSKVLVRTADLAGIGLGPGCCSGS